MNIGLLMTYNEIDVIDEMMTHNAPFVDTIFALDGSNDGTREFLENHDKVELVFKDEDVAPKGRVRDFHRQVLLDAAHERYGVGQWFTLMHGDEFFHDDPRLIIERAKKQGAKRVNWAAMQFFMHLSDEPLDMSLGVQERLRWYSPFWVEIRQFKSTKKTHYPERHGQVIPHKVGFMPYLKMPILKHYPFRSPEQMRLRLEQMQARGFSGTAVQSAIYRDRYAPEYLKAFKLENDFGDFELAKQGNLLSMIRRWKQLVKA